MRNIYEDTMIHYVEPGRKSVLIVTQIIYPLGQDHKLQIAKCSDITPNRVANPNVYIVLESAQGVNKSVTILDVTE